MNRGQSVRPWGRLVANLSTLPDRFGRWIPSHPIGTAFVVAVLGVTLLIGAPLGNLILAGAHLYRAQSIARSSGSGSNAMAQIPEIHQQLAAAVGNLERAHGELNALGPGFRLLGRIPGLGWFASTPDLVGLGTAALGAGSDVVGSLEPVGPATDSRWRSLAGALRAHGDRVTQAQANLDRASVYRQRIDRSKFSGPINVIGKGLDDFDRYLPVARDGLNTLFIVPGLLGVDHPVTYILAGQNEEERRATGGFIGSLGVARIDRGDITQLDVRNSYDFAPTDRTPLPPPVPMAEWMGFGGWYIRDANWFPNFPTSAAWIEWFWDYYYGESASGVIAFDEEVIKELLVATGPIDLPDLKEHITADNYRERTLYWLYEAGSPTGERRFVRSSKTPFVKQLGTALFKRLLTLSPGDIARFTPTLLKLLDQKHLQLSMKDEQAAAMLTQRGWDGHLDRTSPDYLLASDTTVSYSKVAPFVKETLDDKVQLRADGSTQAAITVSYANDYDPTLVKNTYPKGYLGEFWNRTTHKRDFTEGYYATYIRLYIPEAAQSVKLTGGDEEPTNDLESGRRVVATYVTLPKGARRSVQLSYELPAGTWSASQPYQLLVQKQPGTLNLPLAVKITAPTGSTIASSNAGEVNWTSELLVDRQFSAAVARASAQAR